MEASSLSGQDERASEGREFVLRIKSDALVGEAILAGDYLVVHACATARNDALVVVRDGDAAVVRRARDASAEVLGVVVGMFRSIDGAIR